MTVGYIQRKFMPLTQGGSADFDETVAFTLALKNRPAAFVGWLMASDEPLTRDWGQTLFESTLSPADRTIAESFRNHCLTHRKGDDHG